VSDTPAVTASAPAPDPPEGFTLDLARLNTRYVNFCRVTSTAEEVVLDLGMHSIERDAEPIWVAEQRISLGLYTATRLLNALQSTLQQYEATFGVVEPDIEKRLTRR
jgi:hypothetical protein